MVSSMWPGGNGTESPLPVPNVVVARSGTPLDELSPEAVRGILVNPIYKQSHPVPTTDEILAPQNDVKALDFGAGSSCREGRYPEQESAEAEVGRASARPAHWPFLAALASILFTPLSFASKVHPA
jgi:hypothetical protein